MCVGVLDGVCVGGLDGAYVGVLDGACVGNLDGVCVGAEGEYVGASIITVVDGNAVGSRYVTDLNSKYICTIITNRTP